METKAHHVLIGAFTLVVIGLVIVFALWLAKASLNKQYHTYEIIFTEAVTGLTKGSTVQYNGIQVGQVIQLKLDKEDPRKVLALIQVGADTPIRVDTRAKVAMSSLTGPVTIQLTGGAPDSAPLLPTTRNPVPIIKSETSALSQLLASGSDLVTTLNGILNRLSLIVSPTNVAHVNAMLANLDATTSTLAGERNELKTLIEQASAASTKLNRTLGSLNQLATGPGRQTLEHAEAAMASLQKTTRTLNQLLNANQGSLQSGLQGLDQLGPALGQLRATLRDIHQLTSKLQSNPAGYLLGRDQPTEFTPKKK